MSETQTTKKPATASEILDRWDRDDPEMQRLMHEAEVALAIGQAAYDAREAAGLTQGQLAERVGVTADEIEDVEMGDFEQAPLALLERIAAALGKRLEVRMAFTDVEPVAASRRTA